MKNKKRMIKHIKLWNRWRKSNTNSKFYKFLVLIKFVGSPSFEFMKKIWGETE